MFIYFLTYSYSHDNSDVSDFSEGIVTIDSKANKYLADDETIRNRRYMDILIVSNWAAKMEAQLYLKLFKPKVKTKVVKNIAEALDLVQKYKSKQWLNHWSNYVNLNLLDKSKTYL